MDRVPTDVLERIVAAYRQQGGNVIFLLQETQAALGYVPKEAVEYFAEELGIAPSRFFGVATFYSQFRRTPTGRNVIVACCGTACHVKGAEKIAGGLRRELGIPEDEDTSQDGEFTLEKVACLGTCSVAPVVLVNGEVRGKTTTDKVVREVRALRKKAAR
jgi:NADH:ubiquinone oxidoreductase subunit E